MGMKKKAELLRAQEEGRMLFVRKLFSKTEVSKSLGVAYSTICRWSRVRDDKGRDWDQQQVDFLKQPAETGDSLREMLARTLEDARNNGKITPQVTDQIVKISKSIAFLEKDTQRLSQILWAMTDFSGFIRRFRKNNKDEIPAEWMQLFERMVHKYTNNCLDRFGKQ
jgi:predicted transcriptional regulator